MTRDICTDKPVVLSSYSNPWVAQQSITCIVALLADLPPLALSLGQTEENLEDIRAADNVINKLLKEVT